MCGGDTVIQQPAPPQAPSQTQTAADYAAALPIYYQTQMEYAPQMAQLQKDINQQLYPTTAGLQENLAGQASQMMSNEPPSWMTEKYQDLAKSVLGENVQSPLGAGAYAKDIMAFNEDYKNQGRNLALSLAGRQQLIQAPGYSDLSAGYNAAIPNQMAMSNYGTQAGMYNTAYNAYAQSAMQPSALGAIAGSLAGGIGSGLGMGMGYGFMGGR